jgi:hypothetical protein
LHRLAIREDRERLLLFGEVHLFAESKTPSYEVILGHLKGPRAAERGSMWPGRKVVEKTDLGCGISDGDHGVQIAQNLVIISYD